MRTILALLALTLALLPAQLAAQIGPTVPAVIVRVIDGDTVDVVPEGSQLQRVRLIGVDTAETKDPRKPVQCYGAEASARTTELALGRVARLETDVQERDRYGRLLGYLWLQDDGGEPWMLNLRLAQEGYAAALTIPPDVRYADQFRAAVAAAREQGLGLWGACAAFGVPATEQTAEPDELAVGDDGPGGRAAPISAYDCPSTHPIKGNRQSMIYHVPGGQFYGRTQPEDCFATEANAQAAGYRKSLR